MLTIDALRQNPWTVIDHPLPPDASPLLLTLAELAAQYCRASEYALMKAAREGDYIPTGWQAKHDMPDAHEESEARWFDADEKCREMAEIMRQRASS